LSDNFGGLRFYGADSLTTSPAGAAIQFFGNNATSFPGQLYLDSGAHNSAALIFRTAPTGGTITERMRVTSDGRVGIGTNDPLSRLHVVGGVFADSVHGRINSGIGDAVSGITFGSGAGVSGESSSSGRGVYGRSTSGRGVYGQSDSNYGVYGSSGSGTGVFGTSFTGYAGEFAGRIRVASIPQLPTNAQLCFNINGDLLQCGASSLRLKSDVRSFIGGLDIVRRLRPISFQWKESGMADIGLGAEEVAEVAPSFVFSNSTGAVTGVKYERLNMVLINAIKEQQAQIEQQQNQIESLKKLVCLAHPDAEVCKAGGK